jgi:hypothetical protein
LKIKFKTVENITYVQGQEAITLNKARDRCISIPRFVNELDGETLGIVLYNKDLGIYFFKPINLIIDKKIMFLIKGDLEV